jgi:DNA (cytosine-5)-methyltransferase 1
VTIRGGPTVAAFYCGAGGLDLGFERAGFDLLFANDIDAVAVHTHRALSRARIAVAGDVQKVALEAAMGADVVIGGPPCQGFSVAGKMDPHDARSRHVWTFLSLVSRIKPKAFVMENVKNLYDNDRWSELREDLLSAARILGYSTRLSLLNAADFGAPQDRNRMFLIGIRGVASVPEIKPNPKLRPISVRQALGRLPRYGEPGNDTLCTAEITAAAKPVLRRSPYAGMLFNGAGRPLDLERPSTTLPASMGGNRTPIIEQNILDDPDEESWIRRYHAHLWSGGKPLAFGPIDSPLRRLTVEEAGVLQGFPIGVKFAGQTTAQYRQIGNSVPPPLAEAVARHLLNFIDTADVRSSVPTMEEAELISNAVEGREQYRLMASTQSLDLIRKPNKPVLRDVKVQVTAVGAPQSASVVTF